jgi:hypothetical protein
MALLVLRRVGLCVGQNQMCHLCGWPSKIKSAVGKILKTCVGLSVAKLVCDLCQNTVKLSAEFGRPKSLVKMSKVDGLGVLLMVVVSSFRLACNVLQIGDGRAFQHKS